MFTVNKNPTKTHLRKFGSAMFIGFFVIGAALLFIPSIRAGDIELLEWSASATQLTAVGLQLLGVGIWIISLTAPGVAKPIYVTWMSVAVPIGIVMSTIMLTVLYIVLLPVFSIIVRFGDPLRKKLSAKGSYWEDYKPHEATIDRMAKPF